MAGWRGHVIGAGGAFGAAALGLVVTGGGALLLAPPAFIESALPAAHGLGGGLHEAATFGLLFYTCAFFGLFPDCDLPSMGRRITVALLMVAEGVFFAHEWWIAGAAALLLVVLAWRAPHRGWTHSIAAAVLVPAGVAGLPLLYIGDPGAAVLFSAAGMLGYLTHLQLDGLLIRFR